MRQLIPQTFDEIVEGHDGEVFATCYLPDGSLIATVGWDGFLRLWDPGSAKPMLKIRAGVKPLAACAVTADGQRYLTGSMEGILAIWDAATQTPIQTTVAHTRPISGISLAPDGLTLATAGWDRTVQIRRLDRDRDIKTLHGHQDILTGCAFFPDGKYLLSWSADGTLRGWDILTSHEEFCLAAHSDRVTSAAISPDGTSALSGSRDGSIKLWDLQDRRLLLSLPLGTEVRGLFFLLDGQSAVAVDAEGGVVLLSLPGLQVESDAQTQHKVMCAALAPSGRQLALGGEDGYLHLVEIQGETDAPLFVTPTRTEKASDGLLARLFGSKSKTELFTVTCPRCRTPVEFKTLPDKPIHCRQCQQAIRINARAALGV